MYICTRTDTRAHTYTQKAAATFVITTIRIPYILAASSPSEITIPRAAALSPVFFLDAQNKRRKKTGARGERKGFSSEKARARALRIKSIVQKSDAPGGRERVALSPSLSLALALPRSG